MVIKKMPSINEIGITVRGIAMGPTYITPSSMLFDDRNSMYYSIQSTDFYELELGEPRLMNMYVQCPMDTLVEMRSYRLM